MNRLLTLATTGLFAAGLGILPVSVFAQPAASAAADAKVTAPVHSVTHHATTPVTRHAVTPTRGVAIKGAVTTKDAAKATTGTKLGTAPAVVAPSGAATKPVGHTNGA